MRVVLLAWVFVGGCAPVHVARPSTTAAIRAANDFSCPSNEVQITNVGGTSYRAEGCGKRATYTCIASDFDAYRFVRDYACRLEEAPTTTPSAPQ